MDLLKDLKMSLLNFNYNMIYMIHKTLVSIKNKLNYLKDSTFECFFKEYNRLLILKKINFFFITFNRGKFEENIIKDIRNLFRLKKEELNYIAIKDIRNLLDKKKKLKQLKIEYLGILKIFLCMKK